MRSMSALDEIAKKGPENASGKERCDCWVLVRCRMDFEALEFWKRCVQHCRALSGRYMREWECANLFVEAFLAAHDRDDPLRYSVNHKVFERDGWRCRVPCFMLRASLCGEVGQGTGEDAELRPACAT